MSFRNYSQECIAEEEYRSFMGRKMFFLILLLIGIVLLAGWLQLGSANISVLDVYSAILTRSSQASPSCYLFQART